MALIFMPWESFSLIAKPRPMPHKIHPTHAKMTAKTIPTPPSVREVFARLVGEFESNCAEEALSAFWIAEEVLATVAPQAGQEVAPGGTSLSQ